MQQESPECNNLCRACDKKMKGQKNLPEARALRSFPSPFKHRAVPTTSD
jgi:hypothetical protein